MPLLLRMIHSAEKRMITRARRYGHRCSSSTSDFCSSRGARDPEGIQHLPQPSRVARGEIPSARSVGELPEDLRVHPACQGTPGSTPRQETTPRPAPSSRPPFVRRPPERELPRGNPLHGTLVSPVSHRAQVRLETLAGPRDLHGEVCVFHRLRIVVVHLRRKGDRFARGKTGHAPARRGRSCSVRAR